MRLESRALLDKIDYEKGTVMVDGKEYPLLGTVIEKTGTKASDLSGIEATFSGKGAYPPLPVTEL